MDSQSESTVGVEFVELMSRSVGTALDTMDECSVPQANITRIAIMPL